MAIKDFKAKRIRTSTIIGSGSSTGGSPHTMIYSASVASNFEGGIDPNYPIRNVGLDIGLFISGSPGSRAAWVAGTATIQGGTTLIGGDLFVSGSVLGPGGVIGGGGGGNVWVDGGTKTKTTSSVSIGVDAYVDGYTGVAPFPPAMADAFFFVSGTMSSTGRRRDEVPNASVSVFGGDLVVSGTLYAERQVIEVDETVDGDFLVSGSAVISKELTIKGSKTVGNYAAGLHFDGGTHSAIVWDASDAAIYESGGGLNLEASETTLIMSGGASLSPNEAIATDISFYVSGAVGSRNEFGRLRGTALFGGDVVTSGSLYIHGDDVDIHGVRAAVVLDANTTSAIVWDSPGDTDQASADAKIYETGGSLYFSASVDSRVEAVDDVILVSGDDVFIEPGDVFLVREHSTAGGTFATFQAQPSLGVFNQVLSVSDTAVVINEDGSTIYDFRVESNTRPGAIVVDAGTDQVILGSEDVTASTALGNFLGVGSDISVYISGSTGSRQVVDSKGTISLGGDTVISGSLLVSGSGVAGPPVGGTISGSIHYTHLGEPYLKQGGGITISSSSNGQITIATAGGGGTMSSWKIGDVGSTTTVSDADTVRIAGGTGIDTSLLGTTITAQLDVSELAALGATADVTDYVVIEDATDNSSKKVLISNLPAALNAAGGTGQIQYSNGAGAFLASSALVFDGTQVFTLDAPDPEIVIKRTNDANDSTITFKNSSGVGTSVIKNPANTKDLVLGAGGVFSPTEVVRIGASGLVDITGSMNVDNGTLSVDGTANRVGIGTSNPTAKAVITSNASGETILSVEQHFNNTDAPNLNFNKSRGTYDSPLAIQSSDFLGDIAFKGWDGDSSDNYAQIYAQAWGNVNNFSHPGRLYIRTVADGSTGLSNTLTMQADKVAIFEDVATLPTNDINFSVSGSKGSRGTATPGTAVFGGDVIISGSLIARQQQIVNAGYLDTSGTGKEYVPMIGSTAEQSAPNYGSNRLCPYAGRLLKVLIRTSVATMGSTVVGLHKAGDGSAALATIASNSVTVDVAAANTTYEFDFGETAVFAAGDIIGISVDPTGAHGLVNVSFVLENWIETSMS